MLKNNIHLSTYRESVITLWKDEIFTQPYTWDCSVRNLKTYDTVLKNTL